MWLTGFDAPCMNTMYVDKPMRGHGLMQAIARVNRIFKDKPGGLVVDYIGIAQNLKNALLDYSPSDRDKTGIDEEQAIAKLQEIYEQVRVIFHGFDYSLGVIGSPKERLQTLAGAIDWVLKWQKKESEAAASVEAGKAAHRTYQNLILELSTAYALAGASDEAAKLRDEIGFFQAVRASLVKVTATGKLDGGRVFAIQQLIDKAVASSEIVDVLKAAGMTSPDISILSDDFLADIQNMKRKNLALEALKKLLNGEIKTRAKTNIIESRAFSKRLEDAVARYHANAISTVEMINELISLAKDIRDARNRGEEEGLTPQEIAFYDALAENNSAIEAMGDEQLRLIAHELLNSLKSNVSVDWHKRESARARMRILVKRILKKYGYPPDLADEAIQGVLAQAELLLKDIS